MAEESAFNPDQFLTTSTKSEIDTTIIPIDIGDWPATAKEPKFRQFEDRNGVLRTMMDVLWVITDPGQIEKTGRTEPSARQSLFIDLTEDGNGIDWSKGHNRQLGLLREALGQNREGKTWSPAMIANSVATVRVEQRPAEDDPTNIYNDVKKVTKLA